MSIYIIYVFETRKAWNGWFWKKNFCSEGKIFQYFFLILGKVSLCRHIRYECMFFLTFSLRLVVLVAFCLTIVASLDFESAVEHGMFQQIKGKLRKKQGRSTSSGSVTGDNIRNFLRRSKRRRHLPKIRAFKWFWFFLDRQTDRPTDKFIGFIGKLHFQ